MSRDLPVLSVPVPVAMASALAQYPVPRYSLLTIRRPLFRLKIGIVVMAHIIMTILEGAGLKTLSGAVSPVILILVHGRAELRSPYNSAVGIESL